MILDQADNGTLIAQASGAGSWQLLSYSCPINPIHAAVLRTGRILFIAGSGNNPNNTSTTNGAAVLNLSNGTFTRPTTPTDGTGSPFDLFCVGHSFLSDGRLMCVGGTEQYDPFVGLTLAVIFDPSTNQWVKESNQPDGARWYPTVITMGDGRVVAIGGIDETGGQVDNYPESYLPGNPGTWSYFSGAELGWAYPTSRFPMYSHLFLMQDGRLFFSGAYFESTGVATSILTLPTSYQGQIIETPVSGLQNPDYGDQAASVLLPPAQDQKVMIIGGGNGYYGNTTTRVNIIDLKASSPTYTAAAPLNFKRMHHNAVLLPDRTVFVCNGGAMGEDANQGTRTPEIYNPATNTWTTAATAQKTRLYHALAVLLPDGRVLTTGGNPARGTEEKSIEIYSPAYMSQTRPTISSAPTSATYGATITVNTSQANSVKWVHLIRPMATTHGLDTDQRLVDLPISSRTSNSVNVTVTSNRNIAPPGYYMLFIVNNSNVPSQAKWIQIT
ncbi:galactose oxidase early set domain-containing protein [Brasilonema sp. UFV-L1]|uniref:galactose oxidase early set domain-containing protein n=1 Tax=Brasilonema sp. UFV-L1 TaxID=2234130 RepID=UPI00145E8396|nr:galactose oxidase early set domain-containing protein [Brasilonema sp. UFV-L1]NMG10416.1 galactose oxidase [Brasilonema sp. UFV-L1]